MFARHVTGHINRIRKRHVTQHEVSEHSKTRASTRTSSHKDHIHGPLSCQRLMSVFRESLPDEDSSASLGVSALHRQHRASELGSSQQAVSCTEARSQVETCDTQPGTCSASCLCDSVQAGASKSQQAPQCSPRGVCAVSRQAASDDNCKSGNHFPPSSCDFTASETHSPAVAVRGTNSCSPAAAQELPAGTQDSATAKQAAAAAAPAVAGPRPLSPSCAMNGPAMPQGGSTPQAKATQTAAEMLQWLDAALAGKKLAAVKASTAGAATEPKVFILSLRHLPYHHGDTVEMPSYSCVKSPLNCSMSHLQHGLKFQQL